MVKEGRAAKKRITRNNKCRTRRKAGLTYEGQSINYDDIRIKKAFAYNFDLSNEFVVATPKKRKLEAIENRESLSVQKKKRRKQPSSKKKQPAKEENVEEVKQIETMFGEIEDFELMKEVVPRIKDQYVIRRKRKRPKLLNDEKDEPKSSNKLAISPPLTNEIVNETEDIKMDLQNSIVEETDEEEIQMPCSSGHISRINEEIVDETENVKMHLQNSIVEETEQIQMAKNISVNEEMFEETQNIKMDLQNSIVEETEQIQVPNQIPIIDEKEAAVNVSKDISVNEEIFEETLKMDLQNSIVEEMEQIQIDSGSGSQTSTININEEIVEETEQIQVPKNISVIEEIVEETEQIQGPKNISVIEEIVEETEQIQGPKNSVIEEIVEETEQIQVPKNISVIEEIVEETEQIQGPKNISVNEEIFEETQKYQIDSGSQTSTIKTQQFQIDSGSQTSTIKTQQFQIDSGSQTSTINVNEEIDTGTEQIKVSKSHIFNEEEEEEDDEMEDDNKIDEIVAETEQSIVLQKLLELCEQGNVINWQEFASSTSLENCSKLGEGTYGEVFKISINGEECALKVIPFAVTPEECNKIVNGDYLKPPTSTYNELSITRELSKLSDEAQTPLNGFVTSGFIRLIHCAVVKGFYPEPLLNAWDSYQIQKPSLAENERPTEYATDDQHFLLFALSNGGIDLESFKIRKQKESYSIFYQIAYSLAIAEEALEFEHRDLHIGNVLIDKCDEREIIKYIYDGADVNIKSFGVRASIIDFTNSRIRKDGLGVYIDLSEEEDLFKGRGEDEKDGDYQFDIYRLMRNENCNNWVQFNPKTNLLWLHYLSKKLFDLPHLFRKRRESILEMFNKLLNVERVRDFLNDAQFLKEFADYKD